MTDVTRDELRDLRDDLAERLSSGFHGVNTRLDTLNGRTAKSEAAIAAGDVRLRNLEREVFDRRRRRSTDGDHEHAGDENRPALTRRELKLIWSFVTVVAGLVAWVVSILR